MSRNKQGLNFSPRDRITACQAPLQRISTEYHQKIYERNQSTKFDDIFYIAASCRPNEMPVTPSADLKASAGSQGTVPLSQTGHDRSVWSGVRFIIAKYYEYYRILERCLKDLEH